MTKKNKKTKNMHKCKSKRKYKTRKHKDMPQILTNIGKAIVGGAKGVAHGVNVSLQKAEARRLEKDRLESLIINFARRNHLKIDREIPGKFWLDPYHSIYVDVTNPRDVEEAERKIRTYIRESPAKIARYESGYGYEYPRQLRRSETSMWDW